jgi:cystinosin
MVGDMASINKIQFTYYIDNFEGITGDPVKFGLGFLSMVFDVIFMVQHYILYR